jgi:hypothetical protein
MPVLWSDKDRCLQCDVVVDRKGRTLSIYNGAICGEFLLAKIRKRENMLAAASPSSEKNIIIWSVGVDRGRGTLSYISSRN